MAKYKVLSEDEVVFENDSGQIIKLTFADITDALKDMYLKHISSDVADVVDSYNEETMCSDDYYSASEDKKYLKYVVEEVFDNVDFSVIDDCFELLDDDLDIEELVSGCEDYNEFNHIDVEAWEDEHCDPYPPMTDAEFWEYTQGR